jgi:hypothetical protein
MHFFRCRVKKFVARLIIRAVLILLKFISVPSLRGYVSFKKSRVLRFLKNYKVPSRLYFRANIFFCLLLTKLFNRFNKKFLYARRKAFTAFARHTKFTFIFLMLQNTLKDALLAVTRVVYMLRATKARLLYEFANFFILFFNHDTTSLAGRVIDVTARLCPIIFFEKQVKLNQLHRTPHQFSLYVNSKLSFSHSANFISLNLINNYFFASSLYAFYGLFNFGAFDLICGLLS